MGVDGVTSTSGTGNLAQAVAGNQQLGQQEFLKLLITELSNQDPLSPQDDKEFLAQMAQFSTVEGLTNMSKSMSQLQGAALIGKTVDVKQTTDGAVSQFTGVVKAIKFQPDGVHFLVNDTDVTLDQLVQVREG